MEGNGRATTAFMRQLKKMFEEVPDIVWDHGAIIIPDPAKLEKVLPKYYKTSKFSSFQRQLNNFGYHRSYTSHDRIDRGKSRGVCYHKVAGAPACVDIEGLLSLRPLAPAARRRRFPNVHEDDDMLTDAARCLLSMTGFVGGKNYHHHHHHKLASATNTTLDAAPATSSNAPTPPPPHRVEQWI